MSTLSTIVLTRNRKDILPKTLPSIAFSDEIIVKECGEITDFAATRNQAMTKTRGDWVLFVDCDEVVSSGLKEEIQNRIKDRESGMQGYRLRRLDVFWGKPLLHGETGNFFEIRLAKKETGRWERKVHERWVINSPVGVLKNPLYHFSHSTISDFLRKLNFYATLDAEVFLASGKKFNFLEFLVKPIAKFLLNFIFRGGFLDGYPGFVMAYMMSLNSLIVRVKQYDLSRTL